MSFYKRIIKLIGKQHRRESFFLMILILLGVLLETLGLSSIFPILTIISKPEIVNEYPTISSYLIKFSPANINILNSFNFSNEIKILYSALTLFFVLIFVKTFTLILLAWYQSSFVAKIKLYWMNKFLAEYLAQPFIFHLEKNSANLIKNVESSANIAGVIGRFVTIITEIFIFASFLTVLIIAEPTGSLIIFSTFSIAALVFIYFSRKKLYFWGKESYFNNIYSLKHIQQALGGIKETKLLNKESFFKNIYSFHISKLINADRNIEFINALPRLWLELLFAVLIIFLVVLFSIQLNSIVQVLPVIGIFAVAGFRLLPSINRILTGLQYLRSMKPPVEIIHDEYLKINKIRNLDEEMDKSINFTNSIKLTNIEFSYDRKLQKVLSNINLEIFKGQMIGFFGESGAGKSTLIEIIVGLLEPSTGEIAIDNTIINKKNLRAWQKKIGYVPQNIYLLDNSIRKNIAFGLPENEINDNQINNAIKGANLEKFIDTLPQKLDTAVGERGTHLSAGQRQRLGIARALYYNHEVIIFDESTSNLDTKNEDEILQLISTLKRKKTILMISHRKSAIKFCDVICHMDKGKVKY